MKKGEITLAKIWEVKKAKKQVIKLKQEVKNKIPEKRRPFGDEILQDFCN